MSYSTFIHSGIVNPSKPNLPKKTPVVNNIVTMEVNLLTKILESMRENAKSNVEIQNIITNIVDLKNQGTLTVNKFDQIVARKEKNLELETIKKLAGI